MEKANRHVRAVVGRILLIGSGLQIILGILWMCCNFGVFQEFGESLFYIEVSKSFLCDEYTGALYPVLLMLARGIEELLHIPYTYVIQLVQLFTAVCVGHLFLGAVGIRNRGYRVFGSLTMLTFPMAMQCHMAVLPNSLNLSAFLLELAFVLEAVRRQEPLQGKQLVKASACWLVSALLLPEYLYLGVVPLVLLWLYDTWKYWKQKGSGVFWHLLLIAAFAGIIAGNNFLTQEPGCYGRPENTVDAALFRRFNWENLIEDWDEWPEDMKASCPYHFTMEVSYYAENMEGMLQPQLEATVGVERAQEIYRELNQRALSSRMSEIIRQMGWDMAGYALLAAVLPMFLNGRGYDSFAGLNYEMLKTTAPVLAKYYVNYSSWWLVAGILLAVVAKGCSFLQCWCRKQKKEKIIVQKKGFFASLLCMIVAGVCIVWYTFEGAGVWDYKNALIVGILWMYFMISETFHSIKDTEEVKRFEV